MSELKKFTEGTVVYNKYLKEKVATDKAWEDLIKTKELQKVFEFTNMQQFVGEFGPMLGLLIYALVNLFRSFRFENQNIGMKVFTHY